MQLHSKPGCIIAGTGHRPDKIGGQEEQVREAIRVRLGHYLPSLVISGMALGYDQWLAEEAQKLGFPVCAAIPFLGQEDRWPPDARRVYEEILSKCASRWYIHFSRPTSYAHAVQLLQERNEWMVDRANLILSCYNGDPSGGTANCIRYAQVRLKTIDNINPYEL